MLGRSDRFFELLEAGTDDARRAARAVRELIETPQDGPTMDRFIAYRKEDKRIREDISRLVCNTLITPFEREDIESLSSVLSRISKSLKKFAERMFLLRPHVQPEFFAKQSLLVQQATETLSEMVGQLRKPRLDAVQAANDRMHNYEGEADKLMLSLMQELYSGRYDALQMIVLRDLFELLEKVIDRCRDAGNLIFQIVLKNA
jgi:uncharacterized protein